ncbi:putative methyltransferase DDB_G0268948 [Glandiceps talaboti]
MNYMYVMATIYSAERFTGTAIAEAYQKFRPTYPIEVVHRILTFLRVKNPGPWRLAIDVGCGSGQSTRILSDHFETVIGRDVSKDQIDEARKTGHPRNVKFEIGSDVSLPAEDNTLDLVTTAQAAHWFHLEKFYKEVVLKPNGCLAVYGYGLALFNKNANGPELQAIQNEFYFETLDGFWEDRTKHVFSLHADTEIPYREFERDDSMSIEMVYRIEDFVGYLSSSSSYHQYIKTYPDKTNLLQDVLQKFVNAFDVKTVTEQPSMKVTYPIFLLLGRKPIDSTQIVT